MQHPADAYLERVDHTLNEKYGLCVTDLLDGSILKSWRAGETPGAFVSRYARTEGVDRRKRAKTPPARGEVAMTDHELGAMVVDWENRTIKYHGLEGEGSIPMTFEQLDQLYAATKRGSVEVHCLILWHEPRTQLSVHDHPDDVYSEINLDAPDWDCGDCGSSRVMEIVQGCAHGSHFVCQHCGHWMDEEGMEIDTDECDVEEAET
jgi:hypothetical protein